MKNGVIKRQTRPNSHGNTNAVRHGAYAQLTSKSIDGRSRLAKAFNAVVNGLASELGGDVTAQERLLITEIAFKALRCRLAQEAMLRDENTAPSLSTKYLAWSNSMRLDLQAVGLERRQKQVLDLKSYIEEAK